MKRKFDANGKIIYSKDSRGYEEWFQRDAKGNLIHYKDSTGYEAWYEYDANGMEIHYKNTDGNEYWFNVYGYQITKEQYDAIHFPCAGKILEIEGKKYKLTAI